MTVFPDDLPSMSPKPMGDWVQRANCMGLDPDLFFPERGASTLPGAREVCASCVVREQCLEYALTTPVETSGVWGGLTTRERQKLSVRRGVEHGTRSCYQTGCRRDECRDANTEYQRGARA